MSQGQQTRRDFLKAIGFASAVVSLDVLSNAAEAKRSEQPNVLLILVDDLGYGDLSCYGASDLKSPNLDSLMGRGIRLDNFYANCPVCSPTRAALLTGRYPDLVGVPGVVRTFSIDSFGCLHDKAVLLPKLLKKVGYDTAIIGKWHLGLNSPNTPNEHGFDHFHGFLGDMMDDYYDHRRAGFNYMRLNDKTIDPKGHASDIFTDWAVDYFNGRKKNSKPFFLYLAYNAPHTPVQPPQDWLEKVKKREKNITDKRAKLAAFVEHLDDCIGKVIRSLQQTGLAENTLVIFTSDNGGQLNAGASNAPLSGNKGEMLEGGIKVPFCAVWPNRISPSSRDKETMMLTMDVFPTICAAAGAKVEHSIEGVDYLPLLLGQKFAEPDRVTFWMRREGWQMNGRTYYCARYKQYKLLQKNSPFEPMKLYDLNKNPKETTPLPKDHPMYRKLFLELQKHIIKAGSIPWRE